MTIVGQGGIGKTRLALEVARHLQDTERFVPWFVSLTASSLPEEVPLAIAARLGLTVLSQKSALQQVIKTLTDRPVLLVLDNFEQLLPAADILAVILRSAPQVKLLVTSRERLNRYGEMVFHLEGFTVPERKDGDHVRDNDAVRLFMDRARHADPAFQPTDNEWKQIIEICRLVQGMPLAIEHAASWLHILDVSATLTEIRRGLEPRHQSIRAVIDHSWERLTHPEQHALMRLSVFRGGFQRDVAADVAGADLDILASLLAKSFIARSGVNRYDLHELHRQYALEKLTESGEMCSAKEQHGRFFEHLSGIPLHNVGIWRLPSLKHWNDWTKSMPICAKPFSGPYVKVMEASR